MYCSSYYCDSLEYVKSNLVKGMVVEYVEISPEVMPSVLYEDDPKRYWEIWKVVRGYKLYHIDENDYGGSKLLDNEVIGEGKVRLYRVAAKSKFPVKKKIVPCEGVGG